MRCVLRRSWPILLATVSLFFAAYALGSGHRLLRASMLKFNSVPLETLSILRQADRFELLSLNPTHQKFPDPNSFHGFKVLGRTVVSDRQTQAKLVSSLEEGAIRNQGAIAACFNPRHGIHAVRNGKHTDLVICFECFQIEIYGEGESSILVDDSPKAAFDKALRDAHVPLP